MQPAHARVCAGLQRTHATNTPAQWVLTNLHAPVQAPGPWGRGPWPAAGAAASAAACACAAANTTGALRMTPLGLGVRLQTGVEGAKGTRQASKNPRAVGEGHI